MLTKADSFGFIKSDHASVLVCKLVASLDVVAGWCRWLVLWLSLRAKASLILLYSDPWWASLLEFGLKINTMISSVTIRLANR